MDNQNKLSQIKKKKTTHLIHSNRILKKKDRVPQNNEKWSCQDSENGNHYLLSNPRGEYRIKKKKNPAIKEIQTQAMTSFYKLSKANIWVDVAHYYGTATTSITWKGSQVWCGNSTSVYLPTLRKCKMGVKGWCGHMLQPVPAQFKIMKNEK